MRPLFCLLVVAPVLLGAPADSQTSFVRSPPTRGSGASASTADQRRLADSLMAQGAKYVAEKTPQSLQRALATYQQARAIWQEVGDEAKQVEALLNIAGVHFFLH